LQLIRDHTAKLPPPVPVPTSGAIKVLRDFVESLQNRPIADELKKLLIAHEAIPADIIEKKLSPTILRILLENGFLKHEKSQVSAQFKLQFCQGLALFSDLMNYADCSDFVLPIGPASQQLARLAVRKPIEAAFDLGCGAGILALLVCRHARTVLATDINPRALEFTRLNAALNGITNIETIQGSLFEPAQGRKFDLILFNPPYILSPARKGGQHYAFSGNDGYLHEVLRTLPEYLNEGGYAQMTINWVHGRKEPWQLPLEKTLMGRGVDTLLIHHGSLSPIQYAKFWTEHRIGMHLSPIERRWIILKWTIWCWLSHIENVGFGAIAIRRRQNGVNWFRTERVRRSFGDSVNNQILNLFENQDYLLLHRVQEDILKEKLKLINFSHSKGSKSNNELPEVLAGVHFPLKIHNITWQILDHLDGGVDTYTALNRVSHSTGLDIETIKPWMTEDLVNLFRYGWLKKIS
jgi:methylase of polypeptide subunit release factors